MADETFPTDSNHDEEPRMDEPAAEQEQAPGVGAGAGSDAEGGAGLVSDPYAAEGDAAQSVAAGQIGDPLAAAHDPYEGAVPPGYDWPTHGGYLGCLLGLMAACIVGGFLGSLVVGLVSVSPLGIVVSTPAVRITIILGVFVATMLVLGRVGWVLGKRFYREYPQPGSQGTGTAGVTSRQDAETRPEAPQRQ